MTKGSTAAELQLELHHQTNLDKCYKSVSCVDYDFVSAVFHAAYATAIIMRLCSRLHLMQSKCTM